MKRHFRDAKIIQNAVLAGLVGLLFLTGCNRNDPETDALDAVTLSVNAGESLARTAPPASPEDKPFAGGLGEAIELLDSGRADAAALALETLSLSETDNPPVFHHLSRAYVALARGMAETAGRKGVLRQARAASDRATALAPRDSSFWVQRAIVATLDRRPAHALDYIDKARDLAPRDPEIAFAAATIYQSFGHSLEALMAYRFAVEQAPDNPEYLLGLGWYYSVAAEPDYEMAMTYFHQAARICRRSEPINSATLARASNNLGGVLKLLGRSDEALAAFSEAISSQPQSPLYWMNRSRLRLQTRQFPVYSPSDALTDALQAVRLTQGRDPAALAVLSRAYYENRDFDSAISRLRQANQIESTETYRRLLRAFERAAAENQPNNDADEIVP